MIYIIRGEIYTDAQAIWVELLDESRNPLDVTDCTIVIALTDSVGTATDCVGAKTGNVWDDPLVGKVHFTLTSAQTTLMALGYGNIRVSITFTDAAIRKTRLKRFKVES